MNYAPKGLYVWDAWHMPLGEEVHCYHLQRTRPGADIDPPSAHSRAQSGRISVSRYRLWRCGDRDCGA